MQHGDEPRPGLTVSSHKRDGVIVVSAEGDLDYRSSFVLRSGLTTAWDAPGVGTLVLDLAEVGFCDSVGLSELIGVLRRSHETGMPLRVTGVHGTLLRILTITGLHGAFDMYDDLDAALGLPPGAAGPGSGPATPAGETAAGPAHHAPPSAAEWRSLPPDPGDLVPAT